MSELTALETPEVRFKKINEMTHRIQSKLDEDYKWSNLELGRHNFLRPSESGRFYFINEDGDLDTTVLRSSTFNVPTFMEGCHIATILDDSIDQIINQAHFRIQEQLDKKFIKLTTVAEVDDTFVQLTSFGMRSKEWIAEDDGLWHLKFHATLSAATQYRAGLK